jgi:hypothetical protein
MLFIDSDDELSIDYAMLDSTDVSLTDESAPVYETFNAVAAL